MTRQAAGRLIAEAERAGFVATQADPRDERAVLVAFTQEGRDLLANVIELVDEFEGAFEHHAPRGKFDYARDTLMRIADAIDPVGAFGVADRKEKIKKS